MCNENLIEDEVHFICTCKVFRQEHEMLHNKMITWCPDFRNYSLNEKFIYIMLFNDTIDYSMLKIPVLKKKVHLSYSYGALISVCLV